MYTFIYFFAGLATWEIGFRAGGRVGQRRHSAWTSADAKGVQSLPGVWFEYLNWMVKSVRIWQLLHQSLIHKKHERFEGGSEAAWLFEQMMWWGESRLGGVCSHVECQRLPGSKREVQRKIQCQSKGNCHPSGWVIILRHGKSTEVNQGPRWLLFHKHVVNSHTAVKCTDEQIKE